MKSVSHNVIVTYAQTHHRASITQRTPHRMPTLVQSQSTFRAFPLTSPHHRRASPHHRLASPHHRSPCLVSPLASQDQEKHKDPGPTDYGWSVVKPARDGRGSQPRHLSPKADPRSSSVSRSRGGEERSGKRAAQARQGTRTHTPCCPHELMESRIITAEADTDLR